VNGDGLVQVGTELTDSISRPQYSAIYQTPANSTAVTLQGYTVKAGDQMDATVTHMNGGYTMYLVDYTAGGIGRLPSTREITRERRQRSSWRRRS